MPDSCSSGEDAPLSNAASVSAKTAGKGQSPTTKQKSHSNFLKCALLNTSSLHKHAAEVSDFVCDSQLDILFLTETWLHDASGPVLSLAVPDGYSIFRADRKNTTGGGVAAIVANNLHCHISSVRNIVGCEFLHLKILVAPSVTYNFSCVYRPPPDMPDFPSLLMESVEPFVTNKSYNIILGDFNLGFLDPNDKAATKCIDVLSDHHFSQLVSSPTHKHGRTLDWIASNRNIIENIKVSPCIWSDHCIISFEATLLTDPLPRPSTTKCITLRNLKNVTVSSMRPFLSVFDSPNLSDMSVEELVSCYNTTLTFALDSVAPLKTKSVSNTRSSIVNSPAVCDLRREKRQAERKWRKSGLQSDKRTWCDIVSKYRTLITNEKKDSFASRIASAKNSTAELFKILRGLEKNKAVDSGPPPSNTWCSSISSALNDKIHKIYNTIEHKKSLLQTLPLAVPNHPLPPYSFGFNTVTEDEVNDIICKLKATNCSLDICHSRVIKECCPALIKVITLIVNKSLQSGEIPNCLKHTSITPLLKKPTLDPSDPKNYRPITNVCFLLKILDKIVYSQLHTFVLDHDILGKYQSGFRPNHSTESSMLDIQFNILNCMDQGKACLLMFLDLSAAFDVLNHDILLDRITSLLNLNTISRQWFSAFLGGRTSTVCVDQFSSASTPIKQGVPQGACLSPMLFNLYIKPLHDLLVSGNVVFQNYADDTQILFELSGNIHQDSIKVNETLTSIANWMTDCWLCLNCDKTELLLLASPHMVTKLGDEYQFMQLDTHTIPIQKKAKSLGIYLNSDMDMSSHVSHTVSTSNYYTRLLRQVRPFISESDCATIARAIIGAKLDYGNSLLAGAPKAQIRRLQVVQNSAARIVSGISRSDHITPTLRTLHWLPVGQRIKFKSLSIVYKSFHGTAPSYLCERMQPYIPARKLRSSDMIRLAPSRFKRARLGGHLFSNVVSPWWNSLPPSLQSAKDFPSFKKGLKFLLFTEHFT